MRESGVYKNHHNSIPLALLTQRMSLRAKRNNLQPLQIASSLSLLAMTGFWGNSILEFTIILKSFQAENPSADIKEKFGF